MNDGLTRPPLEHEGVRVQDPELALFLPVGGG